MEKEIPQHIPWKLEIHPDHPPLAADSPPPPPTLLGLSSRLVPPGTNHEECSFDEHLSISLQGAPK